MIDHLGLIVDQEGDAGDSCNFTSSAIALGWQSSNPRALSLFWNDGSPVRHPTQTPWNNPNNFTKDQAIPLMVATAATYSRHMSDHSIEYFLNMNPWFFPNLERDAPGSEKAMRPHLFYKDSRPFPNTLVKKFNPWKMRFEGELPSAEYFRDGVSYPAVVEEKSFDWADPMTPDFRGMCQLLLGRKDSWTVAIGRTQCKLSIDAFCRLAATDSTHVDFKQLYFMAKVYDLHHYFSDLYPRGLHYAAEKYFTEVRNLQLLTDLFFQEFEKEGIS